jgi:hypothetical protein
MNTKRRNSKHSSLTISFTSPAEVLSAIQHEFEAPRLTIEMVPKSMWNLNLRSLLRPSDWDRLRKPAYHAAKYRCEICGGKGPRHPVECHEIWQFVDEAYVQRLTGLVALCPRCHAVKHYGFTMSQGYALDAQLHLERINHWSLSQVRRYIDLEFSLWELRNRREWDLDLMWLSKSKVMPRPPRFRR